MVTHHIKEIVRFVFRGFPLPIYRNFADASHYMCPVRVSAEKLTTVIILGFLQSLQADTFNLPNLHFIHCHYFIVKQSSF
jgi:hypothetical protein